MGHTFPAYCPRELALLQHCVTCETTVRTSHALRFSTRRSDGHHHHGFAARHRDSDLPRGGTEVDSHELDRRASVDARSVPVSRDLASGSELLMSKTFPKLIFWGLHAWVLAYVGVLLGAFTIQF